MIQPQFRLVLMTVALGLVLAAVESTVRQSSAQDASPALASLRVMSFNVRYGTAEDGENHWSRRKELVVDTVRSFGPDLLGTQETLRFQAEHILQQLPQYHYVGQSRDADKPDEECGVFFRGDRFHHLEQGHFWLSETPDHPGSKSWDAALPRMATWVKLFDRTARQAVYFVNTHFDHQGVVAREHSGRLIHDWLQKLGRDSAVILSGDFNTTEASAPYVTLTAPSESLSLVDSFRAVHPHAQENTGTYNGFHGIRDGARIDWVLFSSRFRAIEAGIDTTSRANRFPSDHFPVYAVLAWSSEVTQNRASSQAE